MFEIPPTFCQTHRTARNIPPVASVPRPPAPLPTSAKVTCRDFASIQPPRLSCPTAIHDGLLSALRPWLVAPRFSLCRTRRDDATASRLSYFNPAQPITPAPRPEIAPSKNLLLLWDAIDGGQHAHSFGSHSFLGCVFELRLQREMLSSSLPHRQLLSRCTQRCTGMPTQVPKTAAPA